MFLSCFRVQKLVTWPVRIQKLPWSSASWRICQISAQNFWRKTPVSKRRRYKNPPVEEALCEFRFEPGQDWDLTVPGKLQTELGNEYTGKPQQGKVVEVELDAQRGDSPNLRYREGFAKVQLVTEDGKRMVGVGQDVLSIHMLRPYQDTSDPEAGGWDEFKPRIMTALAKRYYGT